MVAVGEILTVVESTGASTLEFRPAVGEQYILISVGAGALAGANGYPSFNVGLFDGTNYSRIWDNGNTPTIEPISFRMGFDNTNWLQINGSAALSFSAIRIK